MKSGWSGVWVAVATPFRNDEVDTAALRKFVRHLLDSGVSGLVPAGTTGEGSALEDDEFSRVVEAVLAEAGGKAPVVPGTGSNNTRKSIERTKLAKSLGAAGALVVTPYYVKPTPAGLVRHYAAISEACDLPLMLYNVPGRTAVNMRPDTVVEVAVRANVAAIKECAPLNQVAELMRLVGDKIAVFSGEDGVFVPMLSLGAKGIVSVAANAIPSPFVRVYEAFRAGNLAEARESFLKLVPLIEALFCETNPIPVKAALELLGWMEAGVRSPLAPISEKGRERVRKELKAVGVIQ